jgi:hypothetical protein
MTDCAGLQYDWRLRLSRLNMTDFDLAKYDWRRRECGGGSDVRSSYRAERAVVFKFQRLQHYANSCKFFDVPKLIFRRNYPTENTLKKKILKKTLASGRAAAHWSDLGESIVVSTKQAIFACE